MCATGESSTVTSWQFVGLVVELSARVKCKTFFQLAVDNRQSAGQLEVMESGGWVDPFAIFHGSVSTISFVDGHAEGHKWLDANTIKAARDSSNGIFSFFWAGGNKSNPDFAWMWEKYRFQTWKPLP